jgi:hypothetical protein
VIQLENTSLRPDTGQKEGVPMSPATTAPKPPSTLGLTGLTVNAMALIAPGAFLWLTFFIQSAYGQPMAAQGMGLASLPPSFCVWPPRSPTPSCRSSSGSRFRRISSLSRHFCRKRIA